LPTKNLQENALGCQTKEKANINGKLWQKYEEKGKLLESKQLF